MKKINSGIIAIAIVIAMIGIASATGIDTIKIGGDTRGLNGEIKSVTVDVTGMNGVGALKLEILYNPAVITANSVGWGSAVTGLTLADWNINNPSGKVTLGIINASGLSGTGNLATIFFSVVGNAGDTTNINIIKKNLKDFNILPVNIEPAITDGTFTVIGLTPCTITAPADNTTEATGPTTIVSLGTPETSNCGTSTVTNDAPPEGFEVGTTTVTWTVTGTSATDTQLVTITPQQQPTQLSISAPDDITKPATGTHTAISDLGTPTVTGGTPPYTTGNDAPAGGFIVGATTVTWTATDSNDGTASDTQLVTIIDTGFPPEPVPELNPMILTTAGMIGLFFLVVRNRR